MGGECLPLRGRPSLEVAGPPGGIAEHWAVLMTAPMGLVCSLVTMENFLPGNSACVYESIIFHFKQRDQRSFDEWPRTATEKLIGS